MVSRDDQNPEEWLRAIEWEDDYWIFKHPEGVGIIEFFQRNRGVERRTADNRSVGYK